MITRIDPENIPGELFDKEYSVFEFEVFHFKEDGERPMHLYLQSSKGKRCIIDNLLIHHDDPKIHMKMRQFLKSIKIHRRSRIGILHDLVFAAEYYDLHYHTNFADGYVYFTDKKEEE